MEVLRRIGRVLLVVVANGSGDAERADQVDRGAVDAAARTGMGTAMGTALAGDAGSEVEAAVAGTGTGQTARAEEEARPLQQAPLRAPFALAMPASSLICHVLPFCCVVCAKTEKCVV